jgi:hypothetical protein
MFLMLAEPELLAQLPVNVTGEVGFSTNISDATNQALLPLRTVGDPPEAVLSRRNDEDNAGPCRSLQLR